MKSILLYGVILVSFITLGCSASQSSSADRYNVTWKSPSKDASGTMPLGNGDIGLNAWIEPSGDLVFYISKTDAWDDNGRLVKVGRVRVKLDPAPSTSTFIQTLVLENATLQAVYGQGSKATTLRLWVDANRPIIHIAADGPTPTTATASIELWRTEPYKLSSLQVSDLMEDRSKPGRLHKPVIVEPDTVLHDQANRIGWYHHNKKSEGPAMIATIQGLSEFKRPDPLLGRTFGAVVTAPHGKRIDDLNLQSVASKKHRFSIHVLATPSTTPQQWIKQIDQMITTTEKIDFDKCRATHEQWWAQFWQRSWIDITPSEKTVKPSQIPANQHAVKIGIDQNGGSRFAGKFGRVSVFRVALNDQEIATLSQKPHDQPISHDRALFSSVPHTGDTLPGSKAWTFVDGMTVEAWIKDANGGRIVDSITPGGADGFLLDTYPGNSLRLIVGNQTLQTKNAIPTGEWVHAAAVVNNRTGQIKTYVNGKMVAEQKAEQSNDTFVVSQAYALQRFIDACAGRGRYPIKFNGSIFTVPHEGDPDFRRWGPGYWWQNTRLPYISMCASGDFEMMKPLFQMYATELMPLHKYRTKLQTGSGGAFIPECIYFWGDQFTATYGWTPIEQRKDKLQESGYHKWEWVSGPELVFMMLDYYEHTLDETFLQETLLPTAREVLIFFDQYYKINDMGKLVMNPSMACETWWDCTNPMPELAGLHAVTTRLLSLQDQFTTLKQRAFWTALQKKLPDLPTRKAGNELALAPAEKYAQHNNVENPELYAVFPFRLVSFEKDNASLGVQALKHRWHRGNSGWRQDDIFMAYLGLANDARKNLIDRAKNKHAGSRFPAFWGPNYDWVPDQDHGGILTKTPQAMLMQTEGKKIFLLPAWPMDWNANFKLHAPYRTTVECEYRDGKIQKLKVTPSNRRKDVILPQVLH